MCISGIYALKEEMNDIENGLSTSAVDIEIKEYNKNNESFQEDGKKVMPGDEIILIPKINNLGIECYIRAKITYTIADNSFSVLDYISGNYSSWSKRNEYYYYDSMLGRKESIELFNKVTIPEHLTDAYNGKKAIVHIVVDAIQSKNFSGDWDSVEIKKSVERTYNINYNGESSVIYENDVDNHVKLDDSFFNNLGNMLPGDSMSEKVEILNTSNKKNKYYVAIDYDKLTSEEKLLLEKIKLIITDSDGNIIVDSNLAIKKKFGLGTFKPGEGDSYIIELSLPSDTDNDYSKLFAKIMWKFSYDNVEKQNNNTYNNDTDNKNPATGDYIFDWSMKVFILSTLGLIVTLILIKNEKRKEVKKYE